LTIVAPPKPENKVVRDTIEELEEKLIELEIRERARTIDIKGFIHHVSWNSIGG
jgi:hypothetical protein